MKKKQQKGLTKKAVITIIVIVSVAYTAMNLYSYYLGGISSQYSLYEAPSSYDYMGSNAASSAKEAALADSTKTAAQAAVSAASSAADSTRQSLFFWSGSEQSSAEIAAEYAERMVVFTASINMKVDDVNTKVVDVTQICLKYGGFVATVSTRTDGGAITLRIPQSDFYSVVEEIEVLGIVQSKDVKGEDVTENYIDLEARLGNVQHQEERLHEILEVATTVEEILDVEAELERIRGAIESISGQLAFLDSRIELATITVIMNEAIEAQQTLFPDVDWWTPINLGLNALFVILQGLLSITVVSVPLLIIAVPSYKLYHRIREKYYPITEETEKDTEQGGYDD